MSAARRDGFQLLRLDASEAGGQAELVVPVDSPLFAGHFPGLPVLPGIAQLALLQHVLGELAVRDGSAATESAIVEVRHLRLRRPVAPGDRLALSFETGGDGGLLASFELRRTAADGEMVSQGTVRCGAAKLAALPDPREAVPRTAAVEPAEVGSPLGETDTTLRRPPLESAFPPPASLLPHAAPALLLTAVLWADARGIGCAAAVPADHPLAAGGGVPGLAALELGAQAAGALQALLRPGGKPGTPRIGYLVGARDASCGCTIPVGRSLRVTAVPAGGAAQLARHEVEVRAEGAGGPVLAAGTISTFLVESQQS
jgi:3-hydroxyacyl-[acyl-carrier-protein] dehydratase